MQPKLRKATRVSKAARGNIVTSSQDTLVVSEDYGTLVTFL